MKRPPAYDQLMAKSSRHTPPPLSATLQGHLQDVTRMAQELVRGWGAVVLATVGLPNEPWLGRLAVALPRGAFAHDLAKANSQFQRMIRYPGAPDARQALRHEYLALWLTVSLPELNDWLLEGCDRTTSTAMLAAVAGHHRKLGNLDALGPAKSEELTLWLLMGHRDVAAALGWAAEALRLPGPPALRDVPLSLADSRPLGEAEDWLESAEAWLKAQDRDTRVFVALVKALLIGADVAGSALPRSAVGADPCAWACAALQRVTTPAGLDAVVQERLRGQGLRNFQRQMAESTSRATFVRAGCGSGKTAGAYAWAKQHAGRKLFFCYPTTGTATEGFADYVPQEGSSEWALVHSRAAVDLADILGNADDESPEIHAQRVRSLESWDAAVTICTVDAVLGLVQNHLRGLFSSPAILNGAFVFDEAHQYDDALWDALEDFLRTLRGAPVLLMTASLQPHRRERLRHVLAELPGGMVEVAGPPDLETIPRYRLAMAAGDEAKQAVRDMLAGGGKVLWVANQVERCRAIARDADAWAGAAVLPYHSRYRYEDRVLRHREVIEAFRQSRPGPVLAATTQVCEVSLDLSADLLVTDLAPVPSLIQRLGRLNRRVAEQERPRVCQALVLEPEAALPYEQADLELARDWLRDLGEGELSQADLAAGFERGVSQVPARQRWASAWLEGGAFTRIGELREPGTTGPFVRAEALSSRPDTDRIVRETIPMPLQPVAASIGRWERAGVAFVAPPGWVEYDTRWGAAWARTR